ncbi:MAG: hypothetical protein ACOYJH_00990 [Anaerovoracaceae bacterium]
MERKINLRNAVVTNNAKKKAADTGLNTGALVAFISTLLASLGLAIVPEAAAVTAYGIMAIVSAFIFEGFVDAEIRKKIRNEKK